MEIKPICDVFKEKTQNLLVPKQKALIGQKFQCAKIQLTDKFQKPRIFKNKIFCLSQDEETYNTGYQISDKDQKFADNYGIDQQFLEFTISQLENLAGPYNPNEILNFTFDFACQNLNDQQLQFQKTEEITQLRRIYDYWMHLRSFRQNGLTRQNWRQYQNEDTISTAIFRDRYKSQKHYQKLKLQNYTSHDIQQQLEQNLHQFDVAFVNDLKLTDLCFSQLKYFKNRQSRNHLQQIEILQAATQYLGNSTFESQTYDVFDVLQQEQTKFTSIFYQNREIENQNQFQNEIQELITFSNNQILQYELINAIEVFSSSEQSSISENQSKTSQESNYQVSQNSNEYMPRQSNKRQQFSIKSEFQDQHNENKLSGSIHQQCITKHKKSNGLQQILGQIDQYQKSTVVLPRDSQLKVAQTNQQKVRISHRDSSVQALSQQSEQNSCSNYQLLETQNFDVNEELLNQVEGRLNALLKNYKLKTEDQSFACQNNMQRKSQSNQQSKSKSRFYHQEELTEDQNEFTNFKLKHGVNDQQTNGSIINTCQDASFKFTTPQIQQQNKIKTFQNSTNILRYPVFKITKVKGNMPGNLDFNDKNKQKAKNQAKYQEHLIQLTKREIPDEFSDKVQQILQKLRTSDFKLLPDQIENQTIDRIRDQKFKDKQQKVYDKNDILLRQQKEARNQTKILTNQIEDDLQKIQNNREMFENENKPKSQVQIQSQCEVQNSDVQSKNTAIKNTNFNSYLQMNDKLPRNLLTKDTRNIQYGIQKGKSNIAKINVNNSLPVDIKQEDSIDQDSYDEDQPVTISSYLNENFD